MNARRSEAHFKHRPRKLIQVIQKMSEMLPAPHNPLFPGSAALSVRPEANGMANKWSEGREEELVSTPAICTDKSLMQLSHGFLDGAASPLLV